MELSGSFSPGVLEPKPQSILKKVPQAAPSPTAEVVKKSQAQPSQQSTVTAPPSPPQSKVRLDLLSRLKAIKKDFDQKPLAE